MRTLGDLPHRVRLVEHAWIPLADGDRLAARLWLPEDAEERPVPAVLEYIPYRKNDGTLLRDAPIHGYFAGHGYASLRVDMRGSGDSDGVLLDEYLPLEQADGLEVLRWLAAQPWCSGRVGIIGKSWGGFNGLQIAAHAPPELCAVISVASTDDRYATDVHYAGGCLLAWEMLPWATTMLAFDAQPPDPAVVGEGWRETWLRRLDEAPPFVEAWVRHQRRDAYWRQGSVCEDPAAIRCPVYMVGGWADAYRDAILRFLAASPGECRGLIGPWAHVYPHTGAPGPAIGFLQEAVRWWDRWLKGVENGIEHEPRLRVFLQDAVPPRDWYDERPGRWVSEPGWPSPNVGERRLALGDGTLGEPVAAGPPRGQASPQALAGDPGSWSGRGEPGDFPPDQRADDGLWLVWTSAPLAQPLELLGNPAVALELAVDRPLALVAVRLCDVAPDGPSTLVTRGVLNLTHRDGHEQPAAIVPGERLRVSVPLDAMAYAVPAGHRLRVAVSTASWPWVWPSPESVTLTCFGGELVLPVRDGPDGPPVPAHFAEPEGALTPETTGSRQPPRGRHVWRDASSGVVEIVRDAPDVAPMRVLASGLEYASQERDVYRIVEGDPLSALVRCERTITLARGTWSVRLEAEATMTATADAFLLDNAIDAYEGDVRVRARRWSARIPRDGV